MNGLKTSLQVTAGTLNASLVHPREVFKPAIDHRAASNLAFEQTRRYEGLAHDLGRRGVADVLELQ